MKWLAGVARIFENEMKLAHNKTERSIGFRGPHNFVVFRQVIRPNAIYARTCGQTAALRTLTRALACGKIFFPCSVFSFCCLMNAALFDVPYAGLRRGKYV